jgi:hypothetical protein
MQGVGLLPRLIIGLVTGILIGLICSIIDVEWPVRLLATFNGVFGSFLGYIIPLIIIGFVTYGIADLGTGAGRLLGLTAGSRLVPWFSRAERRRAQRLLDRLGLGGLEGRHIGELSGGQQQRMFLARAMVADADLILLDEPTSGVDLKTRHDILHLLGELNADGLTILLTTHDLNWVAAHLPRVLCLHGELVADGHPMEVFTPDVLRRTYGADVRVIREGDLLFVADQTHVLAHPEPHR